MNYDKAQTTIKMIKKCVDLKDKAVLEIGCGTGKLAKELADETSKYVAIDSDCQSIKKAKSEKSNVDFRIGYGESLVFDFASFDVVLFTLSLHHQDSHGALMEAHNVLTENGQLVILEPSTAGELPQFFNLFNDWTEKLKSTIT